MLGAGRTPRCELCVSGGTGGAVAWLVSAEQGQTGKHVRDTEGAPRLIWDLER